MANACNDSSISATQVDRRDETQSETTKARSGSGHQQVAAERAMARLTVSGRSQGMKW